MIMAIGYGIYVHLRRNQVSSQSQSSVASSAVERVSSSAVERLQQKKTNNSKK
jgi:hypothetical protein